MSDYEDLKERLGNQWWRLNNLYYITDKQGRKVKFKPNWAQKFLFNNMWFLCIVLKARQLGMTTFIQIFMLDCCMFNANVAAGVIAHNREDAEDFFDKKIKFAYDNLPDLIRQANPATTDSAKKLSFKNGSSIRVGTSLRSGTLQYLHISEFGKICAKFPDKAKEIITGSLNTVAAGQFVFIESTAEGSWGDFYNLCMTAMSHAGSLTKLDFKFFFFPWWKHPDYQLDEDVEIPPEMDEYFRTLEQQGVTVLSSARKAWYVKKAQTQKTDMKQEYPSTPEEAFEQISELAVYGKEIGRVLKDGRLMDLPVNPSVPVDVFFDLGKSSKSPTTAAWFMQYNDPWFDWVDFYEEKLQVVGDYVKDIRAKGYNIGRWFIPHDGGDQRDYDIKTFKDRLIKAGIDEDDIVVVPRVSDLETGIDMMREKFPNCRFHKTKTVKGWAALKAYRYDFNEKLSKVMGPVHDWASHPSDAIRQFAQGWTPKEKPFEYPVNKPYNPYGTRQAGWMK